MTGTRLDISGMSGLATQLRLIRIQVPTVRRRALAKAAESINSEAQYIAPIKTGDLKDSHLVDLSDPDRPKIGATIKYAAAVHARHPDKAAWYLNTITQRGADILAKSLKDAIEGVVP